MKGLVYKFVRTSFDMMEWMPKYTAKVLIETEHSCLVRRWMFGFIPYKKWVKKISERETLTEVIEEDKT